MEEGAVCGVFEGLQDVDVVLLVCHCVNNFLHHLRAFWVLIVRLNMQKSAERAWHGVRTRHQAVRFHDVADYTS
jgi:hypothetical protein